MKRTVIGVVLLCFLYTAGCAATVGGGGGSLPDYIDPGARLETPQSAILLRDDARIESLDGAWVLVPNTAAPPPLVSTDLWRHKWMKDDESSTWYKRSLREPEVSTRIPWFAVRPGENRSVRGFAALGVIPGSAADQAGLAGVLVTKWEGMDAGQALTEKHFPVRHSSRTYQPGDRVTLEYVNSTQQPQTGSLELERSIPGGIRVRVHVAGRDRPLYGVITFFHVWSTAPADVRRVWHIRIPQAYVDGATGGRVTRIFQPYKCRMAGVLNTRQMELEFVSWAMWLSDQPLWASRPGDFGFEATTSNGDDGRPRPVVTAVDADGPAAVAGVQVGDRIVAIDGVAMTTPRGFDQQIVRYTAGDHAVFTVARDDGSHDIEVRAALSSE